MVERFTVRESNYKVQLSLWTLVTMDIKPFQQWTICWDAKPRSSTYKHHLQRQTQRTPGRYTCLARCSVLCLTRCPVVFIFLPWFGATTHENEILRRPKRKPLLASFKRPWSAAVSVSWLLASLGSFLRSPAPADSKSAPLRPSSDVTMGDSYSPLPKCLQPWQLSALSAAWRRTPQSCQHVSQMRSVHGKTRLKHVSGERRNDQKPLGGDHKAYCCYRSTPLMKTEQRGNKNTEFGAKKQRFASQLLQPYR